MDSAHQSGMLLLLCTLPLVTEETLKALLLGRINSSNVSHISVYAK